MKTIVALLLLVTLAAHPKSVPTENVPTTDAAMGSQRTEKEIMAVLDAFMSAFNRRDAVAEERTYHFPHYRFASGQMRILDAPGAQTEATMNATYQRFAASGWDHSAWTRRKIIHASGDKAHVDTQFTRYRKDGSVIATFDSLYILTKENGHWGIRMRSSFAQ